MALTDSPSTAPPAPEPPPATANGHAAPLATGRAVDAGASESFSSRWRRSAPSIRLRLTLWNVVILTGTLLVFGLLLYGFLAWTLEREINDSLVQQYNQIRDSVNLRVGRDLGGNLVITSNLQPDVFGSDELNVYVQIAAPDGSVPEGGRSSNLQGRTLPVSEAVLEAARAEKTLREEVRVDGQRLRIYSGPLLLTSPRATLPVGVIQVARSLDRLDRTLTLLRLLLLGAGLLSLVLAAITGFALSKAALAPLDRLTQAARDIGAARDFSRRVPERGPDDEVGQLAHTFNEMLAQLQAAHNGLAAALEAQRRFVADASHELRTPLTTIRGNVGLLRRVAEVTPADRAAALADIEGEAERMSRLVSQMLSLARADAGLAPRRQPVDLDATVHEVGRQLTLLAAARGLTASVGMVEPARVVGDADALKGLLLILIDNAVTYTPSPGTVHLSLTIDDPYARIEVVDTGIGIDADELPRIFERFYRVDPARSGGGSGLGLAIARWIVDAHDGRLVVESTPGQGSTFRVLLPLAF